MDVSSIIYYMSDLSFFFAVIPVCCFYLVYKSTVNVMATWDGYQSAELPSCTTDWRRVNYSWDHKDWSPLQLRRQMAQDTGLTDVRQDPG